MGSKVVEVKNRTSKAYEFMFDGQVHIVPANDTVAMLHEVAVHGIRKSVLSYNHITNTSVRALCFADSPEADEEIEPRLEGSELIDRTDDPDADKMKVKTFRNPDMRGSRITSSLDGE